MSNASFFFYDKKRYLPQKIWNKIENLDILKNTTTDIMEEGYDIEYFGQLIEWVETTKDDLKRLNHLSTAIKYVLEYLELLNEGPEIMVTLREHCRKATITIDGLMNKGGSVGNIR